MTKNEYISPADYIVPLRMDKLQGRMLRLPPPRGKNREILFVYGHHSTLERWWGLVQVLNRYGGVTMPDLPGFGGMQSFYKIGQKPDLDTMADYLAAFIKLRYSRKRVTIIGMSFGFVVATRMLQRYPDLAKRVDILISVVGFSHGDDFKFSRNKRRGFRLLAKLLSTRPVAIFFRHVCLHPALIRLAYTHGGNAKFANIDPTQKERMLNVETNLWHMNDVRTHWFTTDTMLSLDNCRKRVALPVWHIHVDGDQYFDSGRVEQHMRVIFDDFNMVNAKMKAHAPSVIADAETAEPLIPTAIRRLLNKK